MLLGADTLVPISQNILDSVKQRFGAMPLMWGRYFKRPDFAEDYQPAAENPILAANNIRLLPIARQTARVAGTASDGASISATAAGDGAVAGGGSTGARSTAAGAGSVDVRSMSQEFIRSAKVHTGTNRARSVPAR